MSSGYFTILFLISFKFKSSFNGAALYVSVFLAFVILSIFGSFSSLVLFLSSEAFVNFPRTALIDFLNVGRLTFLTFKLLKAFCLTDDDLTFVTNCLNNELK